jgi:hypothetical protein
VNGTTFSISVFLGKEKLDLARVKTIYKTKRYATPHDQDKPMRDAFRGFLTTNNCTCTY